MKVALLVIAFALILLPSCLADNANMTFESKSLHTASGSSAPYFYGLAVNNSSITFFMPGKGEQRATLFWLNKIPLNKTVNVEYKDYVISDIKTTLVNGTWV